MLQSAGRNDSIPDMVVGRGSLILDASLADKTFSGTDQIRRFLEHSPHPYSKTLIIRPMEVGGSYLIQDYQHTYQYHTPDTRHMDYLNYRPRSRL